MKEESEQTGLKPSIQKTKIMASGPIISWQIEEEKMEAVTDFIFLGSKITADGDCSHYIKLNPRDGEAGGLPSMGSHRVGYDWSDLAAAA